jgi:nitrogen fixation/metabolism regulation signal transduction histidine kinase
MRKLRLQLIAILILTALLPAVPAVMTVRALFRMSLDPLIEDTIIDGARAGLTSTRESLVAEKRRFVADIAAGAADGAAASAADGAAASAAADIDTLTAGAWQALDPRERSALDALRRAARPVDPTAREVQVLIPPERLPLAGEERLVALVRGVGGEPVWVTTVLSPELSRRAQQLTESIRLVQTLRRERGAVIRSLLSTFLVVYGVILVAILIIGLFLASLLTRPLAALGGGIDRVAAGDLDTRVPETGRGEIGRLIANFNQMVGQLGRQQRELVRLEKVAAWRQMARRLAHEIKNPLTPIQLAAQEIRDRVTGGAASAGTEGNELHRVVDEGTHIIEEEVQGLRELVQEFSHFARLPEPQLAWVDLEEIVTGVGALYGDATVVIRDELPDGHDRRLWCDRQQIHRVLINLVSNAQAAQEEAGRDEPVEITVGGGPDRTVRIVVADRGPGVPAADRERIFEPDVTSKPDGMGLGLAIVRGTVESHGGSIAVSDREGGGAVFTLSLPRVSDGDES